MPKKKLPLTEKEAEVWRYILGYITDNGYAPTRTEIGLHFGYSRQGAEAKVQNIAHKGYIKFGRGIRNITIII